MWYVPPAGLSTTQFVCSPGTLVEAWPGRGGCMAALAYHPITHAHTIEPHKSVKSGDTTHTQPFLVVGHGHQRMPCNTKTGMVMAMTIVSGTHHRVVRMVGRGPDLVQMCSWCPCKMSENRTTARKKERKFTFERFRENVIDCLYFNKNMSDLRMESFGNIKKQ